MPELPEVETIRKDLELSILNQEIIKIEVKNKTSIKGSVENFIFQLEGKTIKNIKRRGKLLIIEINKAQFILAHLRMTGQLVLEKANVVKTDESSNTNKKQLQNTHTRVILHFKNGPKLYFNDIRKFGYLQLANFEEKNEALKRFGIEPLTESFKLKDFTSCFTNKKKSVKSILLDQSQIAGLGNIYVDEICFKSKILPDKEAKNLSKDQIDTLFTGCQEIIRKAIQERGTSFSDYRDGRGEKGNYLKHLKVYGRQGKKCTACEETISKIKHQGRGTHFCQNCQT